MIRFIVELDETALIGDIDQSDEIVDRLINEFDTPNFAVLDLVEEGEPAWHRSARF